MSIVYFFIPCCYLVHAAVHSVDFISPSAAELPSGLILYYHTTTKASFGLCILCILYFNIMWFCSAESCTAVWGHWSAESTLSNKTTFWQNMFL